MAWHVNMLLLSTLPVGHSKHMIPANSQFTDEASETQRAKTVWLQTEVMVEGL